MKDDLSGRLRVNLDRPDPFQPAPVDLLANLMAVPPGMSAPPPDYPDRPGHLLNVLVIGLTPTRPECPAEARTTPSCSA